MFSTKSLVELQEEGQDVTDAIELFKLIHLQIICQYAVETVFPQIFQLTEENVCKTYTS